jgi:hypothetical protein
MSEQRRILREVIYLAHEGGYDGPGSEWDSAPAKELDAILESGAHVPVLKSERFSRPFFWHICFPDAVAVAPGLGSDGDGESEDDQEEIEAQVAALGDQLAEADDPLEFLAQYLT